MIKFKGENITWKIYGGASALLLIIIIVSSVRGNLFVSNNGTRIYKMGEEIQASSVKFLVNDVANRTEIKANNSHLKTDFNYVVIKLSIQNTGNTAIQVDSSMFKLVSNDGKEYSYDEAGTLIINNGTLMKKQLNPGISSSGYLVFEVPNSTDKEQYVLEMYEDALMGDKVSVNVSK
jgi:hypothetical protein